MKDTLTIWCIDEAPPLAEENVYRWDGHDSEGSVHSLLAYVEENGERLRRRYLAWIHELGESRIGDKSLIDHLDLGNGMSYWWMTSFVEKSSYSSPIAEAIRLMALEEILLEEKPQMLRLVSSEKKLNKIVSGLCQQLGIEYQWQKKPGEKRMTGGARGAFQKLPQTMQALATLFRHIWMRWPLRGAGKPDWFGGHGSLFFCSFFLNTIPEQAEKGHFCSRYWGELNHMAQEKGLRCNWLQLYYPHEAVPDTGTANEWIRRFNKHPEQEGFHTFLDSFLSVRLILKVLRSWMRLVFLSWRLRGLKQAFMPSNSKLSLWPLMRRDWLSSMRGRLAILNLFWIDLFKAAMTDMPYQNKGLYLYEGQPWERALVHCWRKAGHGVLTGVAHTTVRFWDLRYYCDPRSVQFEGIHQIPIPDQVALNGRASVEAYLGMGFSDEKVVECEALRYQHLLDIHVKDPSGIDEGEPIKILVLGDYLPAATLKMIKLLEEAAEHVDVDALYTIKPHPNNPVKSEDFPSLDLEVVMEPLGEILPGFDVAYASNTTSAALDAYLAGLPVVVMLDESDLNLSPLRGQPGVHFVSTGTELARALRASTVEQLVESGKSDFFFLDPDMPRYGRLLRID